MDKLRDAEDRVSLNKTMENAGIDLEREENIGIEDLYDLQYKGPDPTEEDEALNNFGAYYPTKGSKSHELTFPERKIPVNPFHYEVDVDTTNYMRLSGHGTISPKKNRLEVYNTTMHQKILAPFIRQYMNPKDWGKNGVIIPSIHKDDEEKAERIRKRSNREKYFNSFETTSTDSRIRSFLYNQIDEDTSVVTEDEIDQALFEASYTKPAKETKDFKSKIYLAEFFSC